MPDPIDCQDFLKLYALAIANMYQQEALGELLEQKGVSACPIRSIGFAG